MSDGKSENKAIELKSAPVAEILTRVSHEVRMLSDAAGDLQNLIGNLVVAGAFGGSQSLYELQSLDRLCQNLGAVADFLGGIADGSSPDWKVDIRDAAHTVKLADVCDRLTGRKSDIGATADATGEFDDFESWPMTG
jgi:hypothetical protein